MLIVQKIVLLFLSTALLQYDSQTFPEATGNVYTVKGRTEVAADGQILLISPASSVTFGVNGTSCKVNLKAKDAFEHHGYAVIEVDGIYHSRQKIQPSLTTLTIALKPGKHVVTIYKATEAANGTLIFTGAEGDIYKAKEKPKKKIEFIGDSITCGMGNDIEEIPCGTGEWYDQHNAYYSYASIAARVVGADYVLNSVSGIGMYRNWNDEHVNEGIMPDVYENLYLNKDNATPYSFDFHPDITCIALGTNDFSDGDGKKPRLPFDEDKYVSGYISFIQKIYLHSPHTRIILLDSPMVTGIKSEVFNKCLTRIKDAINAQKTHKPVAVFSFAAITPHGCGSHPAIEDDKLMAAQLEPFLKKMLNEK